VQEKVQEYLDAGVRLVFVADPRRQTVAVHAPGRPAQILRGEDVLSGQDALPGFEVRVGDLFRS
jgi:Uma2 family endonuclease